MSDSPVDWRGDGSLAFHIDDDKIVWRPPKVKHLRQHRNRYSEVLKEQRENIEPFTLKDADGTIVTRQYIDQLSSKKEAEKWQKALDQLGAETSDDDLQAASDANHLLIVEWIRAVHKDLVLEGDLPKDDGDWPVWLPTRFFMDQLVRHWSGNPFV